MARAPDAVAGYATPRAGLIHLKAEPRAARFCGGMQRFRALVVLGGLLAASAAQAQSSHQLARGHLLVQRYCADCHSVNRTGKSPRREAPPFRDLNTRYDIDDLGEALAEGILTGHPAMPEFKFGPRDVAAVLAYMKKIQTNQTAAVTAPRAD